MKVKEKHMDIMFFFFIGYQFMSCDNKNLQMTKSNNLNKRNMKIHIDSLFYSLKTVGLYKCMCNTNILKLSY